MRVAHEFHSARALLITAALALAACGGSDTNPLPSPQQAVSVCVNRAAPASVMCPKPSAAAATTSSDPAMVDLLNWAEATYPQFFPGPRTDLLFNSPYFYRYYPTKGNYIGFAGSSVYILGPVSGGVLHYLGELGDFAAQVSTWKSQTCQPGVTSGYSGTYTDNGGAGGGDGGGDGAAGDGGYFVNTPVVVELADGTVLGQAQTDHTKGMITICGARTGQPVKITFMGAAGAQYFDEARNQLVPFPAGESMTVVVPKIERNIGATAFTEAAYRYLVAHYGADGWRTAANVAAANAVVQQEINRSLRDSLAVDDITRLTIAYRGANTSSIDTSSNGVYSMVNSGFAFAAGEYNTTVANPATEARKQLAQDLTDGVIDGYNSNGVPVVGTAGQMYDPANVRERWLQGANRLTQAFGTAAAQQATNQTLRATAAMAGSFFVQLPLCPPTSSDVFPGRYWLDATGKVTATFDYACGRVSQYVDFPAKVSQMFQGSGSDVFFLLTDGRVFAMGLNASGTLGVHDTVPRYVPTVVLGISNISNMSAGKLNVVAVTNSGDAYAWGRFNIKPGGTVSSADHVPEKITGLPRAVMGAANAGVIGVLGIDGRVYTLGTLQSDRDGGNNVNESGLYGDGSPTSAAPRAVPVAIPTLSGVVALVTTVPDASVVVHPTLDVFVALRRDNTVWAWGDNCCDVLGIGVAPQPTLTAPALVHGLEGVSARQVGCSENYCFALGSDGAVWKWGGGVGFPGSVPPANRASFPSGVTAFKSLVQGGGFTALTQDGRLYDIFAGSFLTAPVAGEALPIGSPSAVVTTLAGSLNRGLADGSGAAAVFNQIGGIAADRNGNVYVADTQNHAIRKISPAGVVTTLAGNGTGGFANGTGAAARFLRPLAVAVDASANVYVADSGNNVIRKVTPAGAVSTFAGNGTGGYADGSGSAAMFNYPAALAVDVAGTVYVLEAGHAGAIRKITPAGGVTTLAVNGLEAAGIAIDSVGNIYTPDYAHYAIRKITPAGVISTLAGGLVQGFANASGAEARFNGPSGTAVDVNGNVFVADSFNNAIRRITPAGVVTTLAGTGGMGYSNGTGATATFTWPSGVAVDASGNVYVADSYYVRKIVP
jgi:serine/threonine protein kinase, bacterial